MKTKVLSQFTSVSKPTFSIGQMLFLIGWLGLFLGLFRSSLTTPPKEIGGCSEIAVSDSGKHVAAAYWQDIHLYRNGRYINKLQVGRVTNFKFIDDETLAIVSLDGELPRGIHFYSLAERKITRRLLFGANRSARVRFLDGKLIVHQLDNQLVGKFHIYDINASEGSKPISSCASPHTNMPFDATGDGRYVAFHNGSILSNDFDIWDSHGGTA